MDATQKTVFSFMCDLKTEHEKEGRGIDLHHFSFALTLHYVY